MYAILLNRYHLPDARLAIPRRCTEGQGPRFLPGCCFPSDQPFLRAVSRVATTIPYCCEMEWFVLDTKSQTLLLEWIQAFTSNPLRFDVGKFWFDNLEDMEHWISRIGVAYGVDNAEFERLVRGWKV